ncbi:MAG: UDP-N-acetylmuramoyl-L-alanyl-D-glutamate--2,6-diaminopimelate ligase [Chloroflexota bacterium]|nr:UDP-N-acetylmuramoyl-L-alanyl-D-glutamate--2,6-diaminopimelate ligase [Chloroflexota bacterium]MDE2931076.1 UDP-N-acetylmuramoyl-L-alanyl-D-glutamate--2,6-diaminopimelate ligase [Chloroflexota bacterium]
MQLSSLLADVPAAQVLTGTPDVPITQLCHDSREAQAGALFIALQGLHRDGHDYAAAAVENGATAVLVTRRLSLPEHVTQVLVPDTWQALGQVAAAFYSNPSQELCVIGVTGTDGKSTTTTLIGHILRACGHPTGVITTVAFHDSRQEFANETRLTTQHASDLQQMLRTIRNQGGTHAVIEASSHGLALHKLDAIEIDAAVLTNLTHEHLDFHKTLEAYREAKGLLFQRVNARAPKPFPQVSVLNADDAHYPYFASLKPPGLRAFGIGEQADVRAVDVELGADRTAFTVVTPEGQAQVRSPLVCRFNVANTLAALAVVTGLGVPLDAAVTAVSSFPGVPGRMQVIAAGQPFAVIVDYAHTPNSLRLVLNALRGVTPGRLVAVFGSAGERDVEKRALMGRVAAEHADFFVITSEDPRSEDPDAICRQIEEGALEAGCVYGRDYSISVDRTQAFRIAFKQARPGDTVLLAGKGHEHSMIWGDESLPWDEARIAAETLVEMFA